MARTSRVEIPITAKDNATRQIQRVKSQLMGLASTAKTVMSGLSGLGGVAGVAGITMLARSAISLGSAITDMATATQTGIEELQVLTFAAREAGASNEQMSNLLVRAQKSANDAARGLSTAKDAFKQLGINAETFIDLAPERKLEVLGQAIVKADGDTRAYGAALDLLGTRNAPKLMEVLQRLGTEGFDSISEKARNAGQIMEDEVAQSLDRASDAIDRFSTRWTIRIGGAIALWEEFMGMITTPPMPTSLLDSLKEDLSSAQLQSDIDALQNKISSSISLLNELKDAWAVGTIADVGVSEELLNFLDSIQGIAPGNVSQLINELERLYDVVGAKREELPEVAPIDLGVVSGQSLESLQREAEMFKLFDNIPQYIEKTRELARAYDDLALAELEANGVTEEFLRLLRISRGAYDDLKDAMDDLKKSAVDNLTMMSQAADVFATGLENGLVNAAAQGKSAFGDMAQFILAELQRMLIRAMLFQAFTGLGGAFAQSMPNVSAGLTSFGERFGGGRAAGGPVMGGRSYMVGERGPEIVTMGANGFVTPNHKLGGPTFNVDMRGASLEAVQRLEQIVMQVNGSIEQRSVAAVQDRFSRAPSYMRR